SPPLAPSRCPADAAMVARPRPTGEPRLYCRLLTTTEAAMSAGASERRCYMIVIAELSDRERFLAGYARVVPALVQKHGGRYLVRGSGGTFLEEGWCESA